jgi:glycosyltransferase involved in cell wall biosynthesis
MTEERIPAVSVVVPLYQSRDYVAAALDSVLAQTFDDLEVVVVDDGSTDGGGEVVREYAAREARVTYIREENAGPAAARNAGIAAARAVAIAFLDSDDLWLPEKLARQVPLLGENTIVHSDAFVLRNGGQVGDERIGARFESRDAFCYLLQETPTAPLLTTVVRRELLLAHGCFDESLVGPEDYDLWLRLAAAGARFEHVPEPLAVYRVHRDGLSADHVRISSGILDVYEKLAAASSGSRRRAALARARQQRRVVAFELWARGRRAIAAGDVEGGRPDLVRAVRTAPAWWKSWVVGFLLCAPFALRPVAVRMERRASREAEAADRPLPSGAKR